MSSTSIKKLSNVILVPADDTQRHETDPSNAFDSVNSADKARPDTEGLNIMDIIESLRSFLSNLIVSLMKELDSDSALKATKVNELTLVRLNSRGEPKKENMLIPPSQKRKESSKDNKLEDDESADPGNFFG